MNGLVGDDACLSVGGNRSAGVGVSVESWIEAPDDCEPETILREESVSDGFDDHIGQIDGVEYEWIFTIEAVAIAPAHA